MLEISLQYDPRFGGVADITIFRSGFGQFQISLEILIVQHNRFRDGNFGRFCGESASFRFSAAGDPEFVLCSFLEAEDGAAQFLFIRRKHKTLSGDPLCIAHFPEFQ